MEPRNPNKIIMSRKRRAPKRKNYSDPKYGSLVISKFINSIMYDGKRSTAERILYGALDKIKSKNEGGATYQVPVEVKSNRSQALALRWLLAASRKRKNKTMADKLFFELMDASQNRGSAVKKREDTHKMAESNKAFAHFRW